MISFRLKYIFLLIAFSLNIIHGLLPHSHNHNNAKEEIQFTAISNGSDFLDSLFGFLKFDLGEDHLDKYVKSTDNICCQFHGDPGLTSQSDVVKIFNPVINNTFRDIINEPFFIHSFASIITRGPPNTVAC